MVLGTRGDETGHHKRLVEAVHYKNEEKPDSGWRRRVYTVVFEADTPAGWLFDVALLLAIVLSVLAVTLESVTSFRGRFGDFLYVSEWIFTIGFTVEYVLRILSVKSWHKYAFSFFGIIDLLATIPTYLSLFIPGAQSPLIIRIFRVLRVFRIFKLTRFTGESAVLVRALAASGPKITVFLGVVLATVFTMGSAMYLIEGAESGFTSIPISIYWAIVTLTTVGYGDIAPVTVVGQAVASLVMIMGYAIIAVPTGIVTVEMANAARGRLLPVKCRCCGAGDHQADSVFCRACGERLEE